MAKRKKMSRKYMFRRLMLVILAFVAAASAILYVGTKVMRMLTATPVSSTSSSEPSSLIPPPPPPPPSSSEPLVSPSSVPPVVPAVDLNAWNLILVNDREPLPDGFEVDLTVVTEDYALDTRIVDPLKRMIAAAREDGVSLLICSAHRTVEYQEQLYSNSIAQYLANGKTEEEAQALTADYYALPGSSEHHTGLAVDIVTPEYRVLDDGYADTPAAQWLKEHSSEYGFILRYPEDKVEVTRISFEPWHFRYVGIDAAAEITLDGLCLEEYLYLNELELGLVDPDIPEETSTGESQTDGNTAPDDSDTQEPDTAVE